jgi:hypothetical protein
LARNSWVITTPPANIAYRIGVCREFCEVGSIDCAHDDIHHGLAANGVIGSNIAEHTAHLEFLFSEQDWEPSQYNGSEFLEGGCPVSGGAKLPVDTDIDYGCLLPG